jgi:VWFA-related protein
MKSLCLALSTATALLALPPQQKPPVFRGGVDLVTVDVAVLDKQGVPIAGLTPADFTIVADGRPRRVVSADYIAAKGRSAAIRRDDGQPVPAASTNTQVPASRSFLFVVDVEQIAAGEGRGTMQSIAGYLDRLSPDDRVGIVSLPYGTPRVDLTTRHQLVKDAAARIVGASTRNQGAGMTVGEAQAIELLDEQVYNQYRERVGVPRCSSCVLDAVPAAGKVMDDERRRARALFDSLRALATAMAPIEGPKALVLVSRGVVNDRETLADMQRFATAAERARVTLYGLNIDSSPADVSTRSNMITAHLLDHQTLLDGMATLAIAGRGNAFLVSGTPTASLDRIDTEMTGYYLLSFESDPGDRDGRRSKIDVRVKPADAIVRSRVDFTPDKQAVAPAPSASKDLKAAVGELLRGLVPARGLGLAVATFTLPGADARTMLAASLDGSQPIAATGYEVSDETGRVLADDFTAGTVVTERLAGDRQIYAAAFVVPPGRYTLKLAVIDASGRRGSVEHGFEAGIARAADIGMSDLLIGELTAKGFVPSPSVMPAAALLPIQIHLNGETADAFIGAALTVEIARPGADPIGRATLPMIETRDARRRVGSASLAIDALAPGEYVVIVRLTAGNGAQASASRLFVKK